MKTRTIAKEVLIAAPAEAVWEALTTGAGLQRWFPLEARVEAAEGAPIFLSWGAHCQGTGRVDKVIPGKLFRWLEPSAPAPGQAWDSSHLGVAIEWTLEARGGQTLLRLVQSGIAAADWAQEYHDSLEYGWTFMLANLRVYLERHRGRDRCVAWPRKQVPLARAAAWEHLLHHFSGMRTLAALRPGESFAISAGPAEELQGVVEFLHPPRGLCLRLQNWNEAPLWLSLEGGGEKTEVGFWLSAYDVPPARVQAFEARWLAALNKVF